jgi:long-chain fatty acid transport protein
MINRRSTSKTIVLQLGAWIVSSGFLGLGEISAQAAGFEKSVLWSAHWSAVGGAAASSVSGPEALFYNPAGLASTESLQFSVNGTGTWTKATGPAEGNNTSVDSKQRLFVPVAALVSYSLNPRWGVGAGFYTAGGTRTEFNALNITGFPLKPTPKSDLSLNEISVGTGYEIMDGLKVGAAYRILMANMDLQYGGLSGTNLVQFNLNGLTGTRYNGFRLGVQYAPKNEGYGFGIEWRNTVDFTLKTSSSSAHVGALNGAAVATFTGGEASVSNKMPQNISVGGFYDLMPGRWRVLAEYTFTEYSLNKIVDVTGIAGAVRYSSIEQNWKNMSNVRLGTEYKGFEDWALRAGYVWTSQVTPKSDASTLFSAPGSGNTVIIGAGKPIMQGLTLDGAFEYSWANGNVTAADNPATNTKLGDYNTKAYAAYLSLNYSM